MPFLLAFWKPIAAILLVVALVGTVAFAKHAYDERRRDEGRAEVTAKWDAANAAQKVREAKAAAEADDFQRRADAKRDADFKRQLAGRTTELLGRLSASHISGDVVGELRATVRIANDATGTGKPADSSAAPTGATDGRSLTEWFATVGQQYRACRETVIAWIKWDDERVTQ